MANSIGQACAFVQQSIDLLITTTESIKLYIQNTQLQSKNNNHKFDPLHQLELVVLDWLKDNKDVLAKELSETFNIDMDQIIADIGAGSSLWLDFIQLAHSLPSLFQNFSTIADRLSNIQTAWETFTNLYKPIAGTSAMENLLAKYSEAERITSAIAGDLTVNNISDITTIQQPALDPVASDIINYTSAVLLALESIEPNMLLQDLKNSLFVLISSITGLTDNTYLDGILSSNPNIIFSLFNAPDNDVLTDITTIPFPYNSGFETNPIFTSGTVCHLPGLDSINTLHGSYAKAFSDYLASNYNGNPFALQVTCCPRKSNKDFVAYNVVATILYKIFPNPYSVLNWALGIDISPHIQDISLPKSLSSLIDNITNNLDVDLTGKILDLQASIDHLTPKLQAIESAQNAMSGQALFQAYPKAQIQSELQAVRQLVMQIQNDLQQLSSKKKSSASLKNTLDNFINQSNANTIQLLEHYINKFGDPNSTIYTTSAISPEMKQAIVTTMQSIQSILIKIANNLVGLLHVILYYPFIAYSMAYSAILVNNKTGVQANVTNSILIGINTFLPAFSYIFTQQNTNGYAFVIISMLLESIDFIYQAGKMADFSISNFEQAYQNLVNSPCTQLFEEMAPIIWSMLQEQKESS